MRGSVGGDDSGATTAHYTNESDNMGLSSSRENVINSFSKSVCLNMTADFYLFKGFSDAT